MQESYQILKDLKLQKDGMQSLILDLNLKSFKNSF